jgi:hypothetical protein
VEEADLARLHGLLLASDWVEQDTGAATMPRPHWIQWAPALITVVVVSALIGQSAYRFDEWISQDAHRLRHLESLREAEMAVPQYIHANAHDPVFRQLGALQAWIDDGADLKVTPPVGGNTWTFTITRTAQFATGPVVVRINITQAKNPQPDNQAVTVDPKIAFDPSNRRLEIRVWHPHLRLP